jgi:GWxTD domain-containing protein
MKRIILFYFLFFVIFLNVIAQKEPTRPKTIVELFNLKIERSLNAKSEIIRFLNENGSTTYHINYKITNNSLQFIQKGNDYLANLEVGVQIFYEENMVTNEKYHFSPVAKNITIAQSENNYFLDKIITSSEFSGYSLFLEINDKNASTTYSQTFELEPLPRNSIISDIEISHGVSTNLVDSLDKFQRYKWQFYVDPIPIIATDERDFVVTYQIQNLLKKDNLYNFTEYILIKHNLDVIYEQTTNKSLEYDFSFIFNRIPLEDFDAGLMDITIEILDNNSNITGLSKRTFSTQKKYILLTSRIFYDDEQEFSLISYFLENRRKQLWKGLSNDGKKVFIERFWVANNPNPFSETNAFLDLIRTRVNNANWRYSHHNDGWTTDMGRIYIKHGEPDEIDKKETPFDARYSRKPYQVWKYYSADKSYLFFDFMNNNNFRLIHTKNDDNESIDPGWRGYFGNDFDFSSLDM